MESPASSKISNDYVYPTEVAILSLSVYYIVMGICTIVTNVTERRNYNSYGYQMCMIFATSLIIIWFMAFQSIKRKLYKLLKMTLGVWMIFIVTWTYLSMLNTKNKFGFYCVGRRCPNSFWILTSPINVLPVDNAFDYYDHSPHEPPVDYDSELDDQHTHPNNTDTYNKTEVFNNPNRPVLMQFKTQLSWLVKDFTKYLIQFTSFLIMFTLFVKSWQHMKKAYYDLKSRTLCPDCYNITTRDEV